MVPSICYTGVGQGGYRVEPVGVKDALAALGHRDRPLAAHLVGPVLPLWLDPLLEQVEVCTLRQRARRFYVVVQAANIGQSG